jgi:fucose permease
MGALFLLLAVLTPIEARSQFFVLMCLSAFFMPFSSPNVVATVFDVTPPEVRSTAQSVEYFVENSGAALAPTIAGAIALATDKQTAILSVSMTAWALCFLFYLGALFFIGPEAQALRDQMRQRAEHEQSLHTTK